MELPNLRNVRRQRLLTQAELASRAGLTTASISRIEAGNTRARISTVRKITQALNASVDDLVIVRDGREDFRDGERK